VKGSESRPRQDAVSPSSVAKSTMVPRVMGQTHLHLKPSIRTDLGPAPMRRLSLIGLCLISSLLVQISAASASSSDSCQTQTRLGGGEDRAVLVGVACQDLVLQTVLNSKSSSLVPFRNAWSAEGTAEDSCQGKKTKSRCLALAPINKEPSKIWSAYRVNGNRCAPLFFGIASEERCTGTCFGSTWFERLRLPRPEGCP
jgi:hypothetical protein